MTPYLLLVALSAGLPVSMGSGELSSLELLAKKIREARNVKYIMKICTFLLSGQIGSYSFSQDELFHLSVPK